jgi:hypothetical protein
VYEDQHDDERQLPELRKTPAERATAGVLPAFGVVWTAAEIMHHAGHVGTLELSGAAALAAVFAWGAAGRWKRIPRRLPWWIAAAGGWLTMAVSQGPLHGWPYAPLTWTLAAASLYAWLKARHHPAIVEAQDWREKRAQWLGGQSQRWGLGRSHLLGHEYTRLGEAYLVDTRGTGRRASQIASRALEERIAEEEGLPISRVQVTKPNPAGRIRISIRYENPWARPIFHPVVDPDPEVDLSGPYSIADAPPIGQDPETGRILYVPLWDRDTGGKNVVLLAIKGAGKTVVLDDLAERVTIAVDAIQFRINLSIKGPAEAERWGPACHLTAFGPHAKDRAVKVLAIANKIIEWRSQHYATGQYDPSPGDPLIVIFVDESDSTFAVPAAKKQLNDIATKGREYGVVLVRAGQRGTADYSSAKIRAMDDVFLLGKVSREGEAHHIGTAGLTIPDIATYGEGAEGVWAVAVLGRGHQLGRSWILGKTRAEQAAMAARIARERAFSQPELHPACRTFLGETYEELLSDDVFATWGRDRTTRPPVPPAQPPAHPDSPVIVSTASSSPVAVADPDLSHLDLTMDPDTAAAFTALDEKLARARQLNAEAAQLREQAPQVPRERLDAQAAQRWQEAAEQTVIPPDMRARLLALTAGEGMSGRKIAEALGEGTKRADVMLWLNRLRHEELIELAGKGPASRWRQVQQPAGGDGS